MGYEDFCTTGLSLSLGTQDFPRNHLILNDHHHQQQKKSFIVFDPSIPSLTLGLSSSVSINSKKSMDQEGENPTNLYRQPSNSIISAVSSFSNSTSVKRERDGSGEEVEMIEKAFDSKASDFDQDEEGGIRKKLRLTKEQSFVLEESFKQHSTLNPKRKQALAKRLNLRPRQVEVWFQNRRARTKLKQNEIECELLKKCCEALTDDNRRLQKEIQELKALKTTTVPPFYMQFPAATLTMCPSCERISGSGVNDTTNSKSPFSLGPKPYIFNPFTTHPSAAC